MREDLLTTAAAWLDDDPDPSTRAELSALLVRAGEDDAQAQADLADRFDGTLQFGTAGLRGTLGAGPNRMNRAVVIRAAAGLAAYLGELSSSPRVVIGYDARHRSADFARDTAAVVVAAGGEAMLLPSALPTPVLAFAVRHLGADAGVMVTASHNPPQDNGYKVYLGDGSQIVPPADADIAGHIQQVADVGSVARVDGGWHVLGDDVLDAYVREVADLVEPDGPRELTVVHTPLHGVGRDVVLAAFERAGFAAPHVVASQGDPDPDFPTVAFPNPEESGAIDAALDAAREQGADLVIANDPDADRCALAVPDPAAEGGWRMLTGDEVGVLLGVHLLDRGVGADAVFASSIVSGRQLAAVCRAAGVEHVQTLTGFKWIARVPGLRYGYEEALGYCVAPDVVRDKDGVSAALLAAELAASARAEGRTLLDLLDDLAVAHGVHQTGQASVRVADLALITDAMRRLRAEPPTAFGSVAVIAVDDLLGVDDLLAGGDLPPTDGLRYELADGSRVVVRPSGTEPKLKAYLEVVVPVGPQGLPAAREQAGQALTELTSSVRETIGLG